MVAGTQSIYRLREIARRQASIQDQLDELTCVMQSNGMTLQDIKCLEPEVRRLRSIAGTGILAKRSAIIDEWINLKTGGRQ